jgi:hypothetical protein
MRPRATRSLLVLLALLAPARTMPAQASPVTVVAQLYRDFAWEAIVDEPKSRDDALLAQPRIVLARYFDDTLTALILNDRSCAAKTHGICRLDFSPIWASQDPGASELRIAATKDPTVVAVRFRYPATGAMIQLSYRMSQTRSGWRVHDIVDSPGRSLRAILEGTGAH